MTPTRSTAAASGLPSPRAVRLLAALVCALGITAGPLLVGSLAAAAHPTHHRPPAAVALTSVSVGGQSTQLRTEPALGPTTTAALAREQRGVAMSVRDDRSVAAVGVDSARTRGPPGSA